MSRFNIIGFIFLLFVISSCKSISAFFNNTEVIARVGEHKLYLEDVVRMLPDDVSPNDSALLVKKYIESWILNYRILDLAQKELSDKDKDVSNELEDYKVSLLKYRYEQQYISQRLDTAVTSMEVNSYYNNNKPLFVLEMPILKARFIRIAEDSPNLNLVEKNISKSDKDGEEEVEGIAIQSALRYNDYGDNWVKASSLAREFGLDYETMLSKMKHNYLKLPDGKGNLNIAYIYDIKQQGQLGPVEFFNNRIKDIILSSRKQKLINELETELMK